MNWKLALTALASSGTSLLTSAQICPPKPIPVRDIKFSDIGGDAIHNYELHGSAHIAEPAPGGIPRALRIDQLYSYALLKEIDISPSKIQDATMAIGVYIESIRPAIANAPNPNQNESYGWVMSHDNGGFDRAIFLHDERFGGVGLSAGYIPNSEPLELPLQEWIQVVAVWRQGGECALYLQNEKVGFTETVIGKNNDGLPSIAIGAPQLRRYGKENDNDFWIKDVKIFDYALSDQEVEDLNCNFIETLEPTIDCGQGDAPVYSCTECVSGDGSASGCSGQCKWSPVLPNCVEKEEKPDNTIESGVNCGDHDAADCSQCDATSGAEPSGCAGDCKWDDASQTCVDHGYCEGEWINVALSDNGGVASQSSNWHVLTNGRAHLANDGNTDGRWGSGSVMHTQQNSRNEWWKVKFDKTTISDVYVYNRIDPTTSQRIIGFVLEIFDNDTKVYDSLISANTESSTDKVMYHFSIPQVVGDTVKVRLPGNQRLNMAEVEVMGCVAPLTCEWGNVALSDNGGVASQSSNWHVLTNGRAHLANDGNTDGRWGSGSVMHTQQNSRNEWWKVKFDKTTISDVYVYNRIDPTTSQRIIGFVLEIFDNDTKVYDSLISANTESSTDKVMYHFSIPQVEGDTVKVRLPGNQRLNMAEVEVMGNLCTR